MAAKAALALLLILCCASAALATYDTYHECSCDEDCHGEDQCQTYKCKHGKCVSYPKTDGCACDDGSKCTTNDKCYKGACKGKPVKCYTKEQCKYATCNPHSGKCETKCKADGSGCADNNKCTLGDKCYGGVCKAGHLKKCPNKSPCTKSYCNPITGMCKTKPTNEGGKCDDGNDDTCEDKCCNGVCKGTYKPPSHEPTYEPHEPTYEPEPEPHHG